MADSKDILLTTFADNQVQGITAADMREFVTAVYTEKISVEDIIDNLASIDATAVLSAAQGTIINNLISVLQAEVDINTAQVVINSDDLVDLSGGITGTFNTATDTVTVTNGIITNIVALGGSV